ncbi:hypothetical protein TNCV_1055471, partial [Trichonephila clavipes]
RIHQVKYKLFLQKKRLKVIIIWQDD